MTILDANVWIAYFNEADALHDRAAHLVNQHAGHQLGLPEYVILEVATILAIKSSKKTADTFLAYVLDNQDVTVLYAHQELFAETVTVFRDQRTAALSFVDAALVALGRDHTVITFDKALAKALKSKTTIRH